MWEVCEREGFIDSFTNSFNSELRVRSKVLYSMARGTDKTDKNSCSHGASFLVGETGIKQIWYEKW